MIPKPEQTIEYLTLALGGEGSRLPRRVSVVKIVIFQIQESLGRTFHAMPNWGVGLEVYMFVAFPH